MKEKQTYSIEMDNAQHEFLQEMVQQYNIPDVGKAIRCLVNYARDNTDKREDLFLEIRCLDC